MIKMIVKLVFYSFVSVLIAERFTTEIHNAYGLILFLMLGFATYEAIKNDEVLKHG